jgi:hypothetical protein
VVQNSNDVKTGAAAAEAGAVARELGLTEAVMMQNGDQVPRNEALEAECARLRQQVQTQQEQLNQLSADYARLQAEHEVVKAERDKYLAGLEAEWAAAVADIKKNGVDFATLMREVEQAMNEAPSEDRHAG